MTIAQPPVPLSEHLGSLNPEQREAVEFFEGPLLVLAGAGSGKTRVLTTRIARLIQHHGVPAERVLAVTFTNKAAGEMKERISGLLGGEPKGMWIGTFHAIGARILRRHAPRLGWTRAFSIFDQDQSLRVIKRASELQNVDPKRFSPKAIRSHISGVKNQLVGPEAFVRDNEGSFDFFVKNVAKVYPAYDDALREQNAVDFDDLLMKPVQLLEQSPELLSEFQNRFAFVLVDEYQDTNRAQFRFLELLADRHRNLMVVGDDDQSIYGWRGADIRNILDFEKTYEGARLLRLERNYRSSACILSAANAVIEHNTERKGKTLRTEREVGDPITLITCADEMDEARSVVEEIEAVMLSRPLLDHSSFAVLYRTNAQARAMEDAFRRRGLPYQVVGGVRFYERREIQDVLGYLRVISNPLDLAAFERVVNYPRRGIGARSLGSLLRWANDYRIPPLEAARRAGEIPDAPPGGVRGLQTFATLIDRYAALAADVQVGEVIQALVDELDLMHHLKQEGPEGEDRADNVRELIAGALDFDAELVVEVEDDLRSEFTDLDLYLQRVALVAEVDALDEGTDRVTLMTLHNAKGLEFPVVFLTGLEEGLFPLSRAYDTPSEMEEERRLFYVGVTRAMDRLYVTHARQRRRAGDMMFGRLSSFAEHIPEDLIESRVTTRLQREANALRTFQTGFERRRRGGSGADRERSRAPSGAEYFDEGPSLDDSFNQDLPDLRAGARVLHDTFGSGSVVEVTGFGRDLKVTVDFDAYGRKKLLARYAGLKKDYD